jgi:hypothetical protein
VWSSLFCSIRGRTWNHAVTEHAGSELAFVLSATNLANIHNSWQAYVSVLYFCMVALQQGPTHFPVLKPPPKSRRRNGDTKQVPYGGLTIVKCPSKPPCYRAPSAWCMWSDAQLCMQRGGGGKTADIILTVGLQSDTIDSQVTWTTGVSGFVQACFISKCREKNRNFSYYCVSYVSKICHNVRWHIVVCVPSSQRKQNTNCELMFPFSSLEILYLCFLS